LGCFYYPRNVTSFFKQNLCCLWSSICPCRQGNYNVSLNKLPSRLITDNYHHIECLNTIKKLYIQRTIGTCM